MSVFVEKFSFFHAENLQILAYTIPGRKGALSIGERLINWVWYYNVDIDSDEYRHIMTDKNGASHRYTLPPGDNMDRTIWSTQKQRAKELLPPQFSELVDKTASPFVQAITDLEPPSDGKAWVLDGKAVLIGDALSGFRPHTAASTSQAAFHALNLAEVFAGSMSREEYERQVMQFARGMQRQGVMLGNRSQFGDHPLQR
jgi:2-polyprenyl-6-methoxyphenol hydroxylase-like FAD-dependent oxidoreductase